MNALLKSLNRFSPLFAALVALIAVAELAVYLGRFFRGLPFAPWLGQHAAVVASTLGSAAIVAVAMLALGVLRAAGRLPKYLLNRTWLVDILDRLTNRKELEQRLQPKVESTFIDAAELAATLKSQVIGQDAICADVAAQIRRRLALQQRDKPVGVFLFAGPPGVGKTYLGKVLGRALGREVVHVDMTQYSSGGHAATSLFGSPRGYAGSDTYGKLTSELLDKPDALILLDEFEKAHPNVHKNFLTAWNDGFLTEASDSRKISTSAAIFILTTNAAIEALAKVSADHAGNPDEIRRGADAALRAAGFAPEVLSRIDRIFVFEALADLDVARVAALEIESMVKNYGLSIGDRGIDVQILLDLMARQKRLGNSASSRDLLRSIEESIADSLIDAKQRGAKSVILTESGGRVAASPAP